jgi:hypothetical protein
MPPPVDDVSGRLLITAKKLLYCCFTEKSILVKFIGVFDLYTVR